MRKQRGFTLLEVMIALAILAAALTILVRNVVSNVAASQDAEYLTVVTQLARQQMYDVEETLIKDGFVETDQSTEGDFGDAGWPLISWKSHVEQVEIPSFDALQAMQKAAQAGSGSAGSGSGAGSGSDSGDAFGESALGGMLSMLGGGGGGEGQDAASAGGGSFIQSQFELVQQVLKASVRKVTLTVKWQTMGHDRDMVVVAYFTDPAGMNKVIGSLGAEAPPAQDQGANPSPNPNPSPTHTGPPPKK